MQCNPNVLAASKAPFACDSMRNTFYETFGAWPEGHVVINSNNRLVVSTQAIYGSGEIKGGLCGKLLSKHLLTTWSATQANHITRTPSICTLRRGIFSMTTRFFLNDQENLLFFVGLFSY